VRLIAFDWADLMRFAALILRLKPQQFWSLTLRELLSWSRALQQRDAATSDTDLRQLMQEFPDR
jgi:uncharacterized phage protein (TIGR02216 family)